MKLKVIIFQLYTFISWISYSKGDPVVSTISTTKKLSNGSDDEINPTQSSFDNNVTDSKIKSIKIPTIVSPTQPYSTAEPYSSTIEPEPELSIEDWKKRAIGDNPTDDEHDENQNWDNIKNPTVMRFTYGDSDPLGPPNWVNLRDAKDTNNWCHDRQPYTPLNIDVTQAQLGEVTNAEEQNDEKISRLVFRIQPTIELKTWYFGHPVDIYHGIQLSSSVLGNFQVYDDYDSHGKHGIMASNAYEFIFAHISYCDYSKFSEDRSSHQINGKKFPIEVNMLFFYAPTEIGIDLTMDHANQNKYVMVSILGTVGDEDNPRWAPIIRAAQEFRGGSFDLFYNMNKLKTYFSPTWLLPRNTNYYYYSPGSFPVPPCFPIPRVYVLTEPFSISKRQFEILTNIKSTREPSKKLSCTFGLIQNRTEQDTIRHNPNTVKFVGNDHRPAFKQTIEQEEGNRPSKNFVSNSCICISILTLYLANKASSF